MTVAELIAALSKLDPQARVVVVEVDHDGPGEYPVLGLTEYEPGVITVEH